MFNKEEFKLDFSYFIFGIISSSILYYFSLILNEQFNTILIPDVYVLYIPIIFGIIFQILFRKLLSDTICPSIWFEKGVLFYLISKFSLRIVLPVIFIAFNNFENLNKELIAYNFILHISPLLTYTFTSWIYYFIQDLRMKYYTQRYIQIKNNEYVLNEIDEAVDEDTVDINEKTNEVPSEDDSPILLTFLEKITKVASKKVEDNINKEDNKK